MKRICTELLIVAGAFCFVGTATAQNTDTYNWTVQQACASDYHKHCGQYGIETEALRFCMDKAGPDLSTTCVDALVDAGDISQQEVNRRKKASR